MAFSPGAILTAADLNARIPESVKTTWSSPITGGITVGNGTTTAHYYQVGPETRCVFRFILGSTSAITASVSLDLPVDGIFETTACGSGIAWDLSATTAHQVSIVQANNITGVVFRTTGSTVLSSTVPFTWATGDILACSFSYWHA